jgi:hypothetical protein
MQCSSLFSTLHDGSVPEFIEEIVEVFMDDSSVYGKHSWIAWQI